MLGMTKMTFKKKCILFWVAFFLLIMSPKYTNAECDAKAVVKYVGEFLLPIDKEDKKIRDLRRKEIRTKCDALFAQEGCNLDEAIRYAEEGFSKEVIEEVCK